MSPSTSASSSGARGQSHRIAAMTDDRRHQHQDDVSQAVVRGVGAERAQHEQERHEQRPLDVGQPHQLLEKQERDRDTPMMFERTMTHTIE